MRDAAAAIMPAAKLNIKQVSRFWWPLAASWMLMGAELPAVSAVISRLADPEINLGAYGVVFAVSLIIEAPVIMLLSASTALSKDWQSYVRLRKFTYWTAAIMTAIHIVVAFTPLFDILMGSVIGLPDELMAPARLGLRIMTPWTPAIAYRRFHQGVLIRFDHTRSVGLGTVVRLSADALVLLGGALVVAGPGVAVGTSAVIAGVVSEAVFTGLRVRPVLRDELEPAPVVQPPLEFRQIIDFYIPLALTSLIMLVVNPVGSAALSRAPLPIESLAVWPVMAGLIFIFRAMSHAFNEVVVALSEKPDSERVLRQFAWLITIVASVPLVLISFTPLSSLWFQSVSGLSPELAALAQAALPLALILPALQPWISWHQGTLTYRRRTRSITQAVVIFVLVTSAVLWAGVAWGRTAGIFITWVAFSAGTVAQVGWLWHRNRQTIDARLAEVPAAI